MIGQPNRHPQHQPEGNPAVHWLTREQDKRDAGRSRPLDSEREAGLCDSGASGRLCPAAERVGRARRRDHPAKRLPMGLGGSRREGRRVRTVAIPIWVKQGINAWMTAAGIEDGRLRTVGLQSIATR
jgi:hypothetical protein